MPLEFKKATRRALPLQIGFYGPSGSGKTMSALRFAAGLVPSGRVAVLDSERGRASLYSDNKKVLADLPQGFDVAEIDQPYHPNRYIEAIDAAENAGYKLLIIDSSSDSWNGPGGCEDIAEAENGRWIKSKQANRRMTTRAALSSMHILWSMKAQPKVKVIDKKKSESGKQEFQDLGILPVAEKNALYPLLLVFSVDPVTHLSTVVKCHDDLWGFFPEPKLITKADGDVIRKWNETGKPLESHEQLQKRARAAADMGMESYKTFFAGLPKAQAKILADTTHEANKMIATQADKDAEAEREPIDQFNDTSTDPPARHENSSQEPVTSATIEAIRQYEGRLGLPAFSAVLDREFFGSTEDIKSELAGQTVLKALQAKDAE